MKKFTHIFLFFLLPYFVFAQNYNTCGISQVDLQYNVKKILDQRAKGEVAGFRALVYIPVWFHIVSKTDGTSAVSEGNVLDMLCDMNKLYAANAMDMQFYLKGFNYIKDDALYSGTPYSTMKANKKSDGINVFINNAAGAAGTLAYYSNRQYTTDVTYANDWIVIIKTQIGGGTKAATLGHEIGHLFSLIHTFNGWESAPFVPTQAVPCAKATASDGVTPTEKHSRGSDGNCTNAGDYMCDTPEDYNFGYGATGCTYSSIAKDPTCISVTPQENNIMGYFISCLSQFSAQQKTAIRSNYTNDAGRTYLRAGNITPSLTEIGTTATISPANAGISTYYNNINLSWTATTGASSYALEISPNSSFDVDPVRFVSTGTIFNLNPKLVPAGYLKPGTIYYWRVRGFNTYKTCSTFAKAFFTTGTLSEVHNIDAVSGFTVSPNPVSSGDKFINISLTTQKTFEAAIKIINPNGQILQSASRRFDVGLTNENISLNNLSTGLYILLIESADGVVRRKFMVNGN